MKEQVNGGKGVMVEKGSANVVVTRDGDSGQGSYSDRGFQQGEDYKRSAEAATAVLRKQGYVRVVYNDEDLMN